MIQKVANIVEKLESLKMDTRKIAHGLYQYTAIDDCSRIRFLALFDRRTAANSLLFLEQVIEEMPFRIQRIQNEFRPHGSLNSKTPWEKWNELAMKTPYRDEIEAAFDESKERLRLQNYRDDLYWQNLKRSL